MQYSGGQSEVGVYGNVGRYIFIGLELILAVVGYFVIRLGLRGLNACCSDRFVDHLTVILLFLVVALVFVTAS